MDNNNDWLGNLVLTNNYPIDHQQQTCVTKHDLALLHKKIIATDLIVQKYQEANKALLGLQVENDELKRQIEQITNECCIFGRQVTECTQECDILKEHVQMLNVEKQELHRQLQLLKDENTNYRHELMVMTQYESLKNINDQLSKDVERQNKEIAKLHLKLQRKTTTVFKPSTGKREQSETDIALISSQKSVRELKLALGRFVNFVRVSKLEIPTSLNIRPILNAHEINDDFMEAQGEFVLRPATPIHVPIITSITVQSVDDDEDDDDDGDFIDVIAPLPATAPVVIPELPPVPSSSTSKYSLRKQKKSKEVLPPAKVTKKKATRRRRKDVPVSESEDNPWVKIDDLANDLETALAKNNTPEEQPISLLQPTASSLSDDEGLQVSNTHTPSHTYRQPLSPLISLEPEVNERIPLDMPQWSPIPPPPPPPTLNEGRKKQVAPKIFKQPIAPSRRRPLPSSVVQPAASSLSDDEERQASDKHTPSQTYRQPLSPLISLEPEVNERIPLDMPQWSPVTAPPMLNEERRKPVAPKIVKHPIPRPRSPPASVVQPTASSLSDDEELQVSDKHTPSQTYRQPLSPLISREPEVNERIPLDMPQWSPIPAPPPPMLDKETRKPVVSKIVKHPIPPPRSPPAYLVQPTASSLSDDEELQVSDKHTPSQTYRQPLSPLISHEPDVNERIPLDMPQWSPVPAPPMLDEETRIPVVSRIDTYPMLPPRSPPASALQLTSFLSDDDEQQRTKIQPKVTPSIPINILDAHRIAIVHRLLRFLIQVPDFCSPLKPLTPSRRRRLRTTETASSTIEKQLSVPDSLEEQSIPMETSFTHKSPLSKQNSVIEPLFSQSTSVIDETAVIEPTSIQIIEQTSVIESQPSQLTDVIELSPVVESPTLQPNNIIAETSVFEPASITHVIESTLSQSISNVTEETPSMVSLSSQSTSVINETPVIESLSSQPISVISDTSVIKQMPVIKPPPSQPTSVIEETSVIEPVSIVIEQPPKSLVFVAPMKIPETKFTIDEQITKSVDPIAELPAKPSLKSSHISTVSRLLVLLTRLPVIPLVLPWPLPAKQKTQSPIGTISPAPIIRRQSSRLVPLPTTQPPASRSRSQTRSLTNIRACISRCNLPAPTKRAATNFISPPAPKRLKPTRVSTPAQSENHDSRLFDEFLNSNPSRLPIPLNVELKRFIDHKLQLTEVSALINHFHTTLFAKSESISTLVTRLHPCEECIKSVLVYINSNSSSEISFQRQYFVQLNSIFERDMKEQKMELNNRLKLLNRLFFLSCSTLSSSSPVFVYIRLFDIAYGLSHDILVDALTLLTHVYPTLISTNAQISSSTVLLHRTLDLLRQPSNLSLAVIENLLLSYHANPDDTDLIRSFVLICRHQSWSWCAQELCSRLLFPLVLRINQRRLCILTIFQYILILFKDNIEFKHDIIFHDRLKQTLISIETTVNSDEFVRKQKLLVILQNCCS